MTSRNLSTASGAALQSTRDRGGERPAIDARGLTRDFTVSRPGRGPRERIAGWLGARKQIKRVVDDVTFVAHPGELVALLGPNGAGKSTLIKMMTGILRPTGGEVLVNGRVPHTNRTRNAFGIGLVAGQRTQLWWDLPARDSFVVLRDIYDLDRRAYEDRLAEFDEILQLSEFWDTPARHLSLGQRVRCDLAAALLHDPRVVFLDEPTIGMDVVVKEKVRQFLAHVVQARRHTVVLTTHDMSEVERLCERVMLIGGGQLMYDGSLADLKLRAGGLDLVHATFDGTVTAPQLATAELVSHDGPLATFRPLPGLPPRAVVGELLATFTLTDVSLQQSPLEDIMRTFYQHGRVDAERPDTP